jgi:RND family efflux transporter MFP subunit
MKYLTSILSFTLFFNACGKKEAAEFPQKKELVESIYASAQLKSLNQIDLRTEVSGVLLEYHVSEGELVKKGQIIATLNGNVQDLNVKNAEFQSSTAQAAVNQLDELSAQIETLKHQYVLDSLNFKRQAELFNQNVGTKVQLEGSELKFKASKNALRGTQKRYIALKSQIENGVSQSQTNVRIAKENAQKFVVVSPMDGKIFQLPFKIGETVSPQQIFAVIGNPSSFVIHMQIDEKDITKIHLDQEVIIKMDAFDQTYKAKVSFIGSALDTKSQTFKAEAVFTENNLPNLYPGLTAEANIIISKKPNVLTVPLSYFINDSTINTADGEVIVKTGLKNLQEVEILDGISEKTALKRPEKKKK